MANQPTKYRKFVVGAASAALVASAVAPVAFAAEFTDTKGNTHEEAINALSDAGIIKGYEDGTFKPNKTLTRSDVVKLMGKWLKTEGYEVPTDYKTKPRFADLKSNSNDELLQMAALVYDNGVFNGTADGKLDPTGDITRENMAIVLVRAFDRVHNIDLATYVAGQKFDKDVTDLGKAKAEARPAIDVLDYFNITNPAAPEFNPKNTTTRGHFATFLHKTINTDFSEVGTESPYGKATVKAVNATHVEVTFEDSVDQESLNKLKFTINGLTVSNAVVKQTDDKTVILTTAVQKGGEKYTVSLNNNAIGTFTGVSAVVPEKLSMITTSQQGVIGKEVTVRADINVKEAGVPVTFNIVADKNNNLNKDQVVEVTTNADGIAEYSYTRYAAGADTVQAYATGKPEVRESGKVYWENTIQLSVEELTAGNDLSNETKKSYKVKGEKNTTYYIAIKENIDVAPDKVTKVNVQSEGSSNFVTPYELTTGSKQFATVKTNNNGEASFTVYGSNLSATPIVYLPSTVNNTQSYSTQALQAAAPTVKFSQINRLALTVKAEGTADSAEYATTPVAYDANSAGGRTYTVTVTDKEGKLAPEGSTAYVTFENNNIAGDIFFSTAKDNFSKVAVGDVKAIKVGKEGKAQFRVAGHGATSFVKPTVFLNTAGTTNPGQIKLDKTGTDTDIFEVAEATYFKTPVVNNALLTVKDEFGREVSSLTSGKDAWFTYQSVDQNGFAYRPTTTTGSTTTTVWKPITLPDGTIGYVQETVTFPGGQQAHQYTLAFDVTSTFGEAVVKDALGVPVPAVQNQGRTKTYNVKSDAEGKAIVRITSQSADTVSVNVTGASNILPTKTATVNFTNSTIVPEVYSGNVASYNSEQGTLTFEGKESVKLFGDKIRYTKGTEVIANYDAFIDLLKNATGTVSITRTVGADGVTTFNIYNISTTGTKPVDTATANPGAIALTKALADAKAVDASKYTADSVKAVTDAVAAANALASSATDAEKQAAANAINTAIKNLVEKPATAEGVEITSAEAFATNSAALGLGFFADYKVEGTVANADTTSVDLVFNYADKTQAQPTKTVNVPVTDGKFSYTLDNTSDIVNLIESVQVKVGDKTTDAKTFDKKVK